MSAAEQAAAGESLAAELENLDGLPDDLFFDAIDGEEEMGIFAHGGMLLEKAGQLDWDRGKALEWLARNRDALIAALRRKDRP